MKKRVAVVLLCLLLCCQLPVMALAGSDWQAGDDFEYESDTQTLIIYNTAVLQDSEFMNSYYEYTDTLIFGQDVSSVEDAYLESFFWMKTKMIVFMSASTQIMHNMTDPPEEFEMPKETLIHGFSGSSAESWASTLGMSFSSHSFGSCMQISSENLNLPQIEQYDYNQDGQVELEQLRDEIHYCQCTICLQYLVEPHDFKTDPGTGLMTCKDCNYQKSGEPSGDPSVEPGDEQSSLIDASKTVSLKPGMTYAFGAGSYQVSGDPTVYNGNQDFYVRSEGNYSITRR